MWLAEVSSLDANSHNTQRSQTNCSHYLQWRKRWIVHSQGSSSGVRRSGIQWVVAWASSRYLGIQRERFKIRSIRNSVRPNNYICAALSFFIHEIALFASKKWGPFTNKVPRFFIPGRLPLGASNNQVCQTYSNRIHLQEWAKPIEFLKVPRYARTLVDAMFSKSWHSKWLTETSGSARCGGWPSWLERQITWQGSSLGNSPGHHSPKTLSRNSILAPHLMTRGGPILSEKFPAN
jgi:hypothetical protein